MPGEYGLNDLSGVIGGDLYSSLFGTQGYTNGGANPWQQSGGMDESGGFNFFGNPNQDALNSFQNYTYNWAPEGGQAGTLSAFDPSGRSVGSWKQEEEDNFTKLMGAVAPAVASWGFGGALSNLFGGGILGGAAGQGLANGSMTSAQGGSFGQGALSGAVSGGMNGMAKAGTSPAGMLGMDKGPFASMVNRGVGSTLGGLVSGQSGGDAFKGGLIGAATSGINSLGSQGMSFLNNAFSSLMPDNGSGSSDVEFDNLQGSGGDASVQTDVSPNRYDEYTAGPDGMSTYNQDYRYAGDQSTQGPSPVGTKQPSSLNLPGTLSGFLNGAGDYAKNNLGDLATSLYGIYNNRRQQKALGQQLSSLQGLYSQNSPYAQQLRNTLNAKAAQTGRRSNIAGRETQLQAALADRYAQLQPSMLQINQARGQLQNSMGSNTLSMLNKMGAFKSLAGLFGGTQPDYNQIGVLEGLR